MTAHRFAPADLHDDVLDGLRRWRKQLPARLLYDARGARLFEEICAAPEYYPARSELALLELHLPAIARELGPRARVIEPGSGAARKTRRLLDALAAPASYVPIDISGEQLAETARALRAEYPGLDVHPIEADYTAPFALPAARVATARTLVFFPGSTIGNFEPEGARAFLARFGELAGPGARLLLGADSNQDPETLVPAYDDAAGVTAAFNRNVLAHLNRTRDADFEPTQFLHRAVWDRASSRIEMHLVSRRRQVVRIGRSLIQLDRGEPIVTEHCYKHAPDRMRELFAAAGWRVREVFPDAARSMHLWLATRSAHV